MIKREFYKTRKDGAKLYRTYSDEGFRIKQVETRLIYDETVDVETANYAYQETDEKQFGTEALYEEINEVNAGTIDDPIPYNNNMALVENIYYIQNDIVYKCIRSTGVAVFNDLKDLIDIYVIQAE